MDVKDAAEAGGDRVRPQAIDGDLAAGAGYGVPLHRHGRVGLGIDGKFQFAGPRLGEAGVGKQGGGKQLEQGRELGVDEMAAG